MKLPLILTGLASGMLLSACASTASMPPTVLPPKPAPWECALRCPNPPPTSLPRKAWEVETMAWGAACKRLHDDCVGALER